MFNWIKKLFSKKQDTENIYDNFTIEYYPGSNRYYPKYKNAYISYDRVTGFYRLESENFKHRCCYGDSKSVAIVLIKNYIAELTIGAQTLPVSAYELKTL